MAFGDSNYKQGFPFEDYISTARKLSSAERLPNSFPVFDYFTVNKEAISVKTLDTGASSYQNPNRIRSKLNQYIDKVDNYNEGGSSSFNLESKNISSKTIELAVPSTTNIAQWDAINQSISYANSKNIKFNITVVK